MTARSVVDRVARTQLLAVATVAAVAIAAGAAAGVTAAVRSDDEVSLGVGRVVAAEIAAHADDPPARLQAEVRDEITEQAALGRVVEVFQGDRLVGRGATHTHLGPGARALDACRGEVHQGVRFRVCALAARGGHTVLVGSRTEPVIRAMVAIVLAIAAAALLTVLAFAAVARRVVGRALSPLSDFAARIGRVSPQKPEGSLGARWGLTEIDALAAAFDALIARIAEALARERRFLVDASHELRTPLGRLRSQLELALQDLTPEGEPPPERLRAAAATCEALVRTTESVLALSRSEAPPAEAVNLSDQVRAHADLLAERDPARGDRVRIEAPDEALIRADPTLVDLAVANLVDNALKFFDGVVDVRVAATDAEVTLAVEDRGPGMTDEEIARAFEPFFRGAHARSHTRGTGLGLALVRHVADAYGGRVGIARRDGGGLSVALVFPAWRPAPGR